MARLKAHGAELFRAEYPGHRKAVMADGHILVDHGFGWKLHAKLKPGFSPEEHARKLRALVETRPGRCPAYHRYVTLLTAEFPALQDRARAHTLLGMLAGDCDGLHAELEDAGLGRDLETCRDLADAYKAATEEARAAKAARAEAPIPA